MQHTIFHDIVAKKIPAHIMYENDHFMAFLDIFPRTKGHTLVIPKTPYEWVYDVPNFGKYWETVLRVTRGIQEALHPSFVTYATHGLEIRYAHIHILPRYGEIDAAKHQVFPKDVETHCNASVLEDIAEKVKKMTPVS